MLRSSLISDPSIKVENKSLNLVYSEYSSMKIDLCCIDPSNLLDRKAYDSKKNIGLDKDPLWDQPLLYGIELKYVTPGYEKNYLKFTCDIDKMKKYRELTSFGSTDYYSPNFKYLVLSFVLEPKKTLIEKIIKPEFTEKTEAIADHDSAYIVACSTNLRYIGKYIGNDKLAQCKPPV